VLFEPAESRRVVQLTAERALEYAEMRGGAGRQYPKQPLHLFLVFASISWFWFSCSIICLSPQKSLEYAEMRGGAGRQYPKQPLHLFLVSANFFSSSFLAQLFACPHKNLDLIFDQVVIIM